MSEKRFPFFTVIAFTLLIIALVIETIILVQQSQEFEKYKNATVIYKSISVYNRDTDSLAGTISISANDIKFVAEDKTLENYLTINVPFWKEKELEISDQNSASARKVKITDKDFLNGVYQYLESEVKRELNNAFYFDLVTGCTK